MIRKLLTVATAGLILGVSACNDVGAGVDVGAYEAEIQEWRAGRLERLLAPTGFLTQVGLFWIDEGRYAVGAEPDSDIRLPSSAAQRVGEIVVEGGLVRMSIVDGVLVTHEGSPVTEIELPADTSGEFVMLEHGSIAWSVIERGGKLAIRVRDFEHPWVRTFGPIPYYDIDPKYRIDAVLHRYAEPRQITVNTVIEGFTQDPVAPGTVTFELDGVEYELEPTLAGSGRLFFVFGDQTNRDATYGAGRYLYAEAPGEDGRFVLDFNKSYSPPCAFNDFSTCPVASPRNRLPIRLEVGEKYDEALHFSPGD
jgi:uncharacterized protein (DUF1684 family)